MDCHIYCHAWTGREECSTYSLRMRSENRKFIKNRTFWQEKLCIYVHQGGQSHGQHNLVHGFPEPVKSFITFVILSQIKCGKVQKPPHIFLHKTVQSFSWLCCSFQDYLEQMKKKRKDLRD